MAFFAGARHMDNDFWCDFSDLGHAHTLAKYQMSTITTDTVEIECELDGIPDADVNALQALRSKGAKLTYLIQIRNSMALLQDVRARLHEKSIARARETLANTDTGQLSAGKVTIKVQVAEEVAVKAARDTHESFMYGETKGHCPHCKMAFSDSDWRQK